MVAYSVLCCDFGGCVMGLSTPNAVPLQDHCMDPPFFKLIGDQKSRDSTANVCGVNGYILM